jgi:hypothetical protein
MARNNQSDEYGLPSLAVVFGYIAVKELQRIEDRVKVLSRECRDRYHLRHFPWRCAQLQVGH